MAEPSAAETYRILIGSRIRSQLAYRTSFWLTVATSVAVGLVVDLPEPRPDLQLSAAAHIGSDLDGQRQRLAFSPKETTAARVLAEVSAVTEVVDLTLEEPAIEDIVRTLYGGRLSLAWIVLREAATRKCGGLREPP